MSTNRNRRKRARNQMIRSDDNLQNDEQIAQIENIDSCLSIKLKNNDGFMVQSMKIIQNLLETQTKHTI